MMGIILISDKEKKQLEALKKYAKENPITVNAGLIDAEKIPGTLKNHVFTSGTYRFVYSHELQPKGRVRHLSVSCFNSKKLPNEQTAEIFLKWFDFKNSLTELKKRRWVYIEDILPDGNAINFLELIE